MNRHVLTDIDREHKLATVPCRGPFTKVRIYKEGRGGIGCRTTSDNTPGRTVWLRQMGLTEETYAAIITAQGNLCKLCRGALGISPISTTTIGAVPPSGPA